MKIGLVDVDSHNFPNLPLMKISAFHKSHSDDVKFVQSGGWYDRVYMSKVFTESNPPPTIILHVKSFVVAVGMTLTINYLMKLNISTQIIHFIHNFILQ